MQSASEIGAEIPPSPLSGLQISRLQQALDGLTQEQLNWASGFLAGQAAATTPLQPAANEAREITILYATQGGNARSVAESLAANATNLGLSPRLLAVEAYRPRDLAKERLLIIAISTQGEGEPPESARELFKYLKSKRAAQLPELKYAIFGLGDSSYEFFCQSAKELDQLLQQLGATSLIPRVDADVDFHSLTRSWNEELLQQVEALIPKEQARVIPIQRTQSTVQYDRNHPYQAALLERRRITTDDALSEVHHLVLETDPQAIKYQAGDAVGLFFNNQPELVEEILDKTGLTARYDVELPGEKLTLSQALSERLELTQLHPLVVKAWASHSDSEALSQLSRESDKLRQYCQDRQLIDLLSDYPAEIDADSLVSLLHPQQPRLYSIASSPTAHEDEVHLTVSTLRYNAQGRDHLGGASGYLTQRIEEGDSLGIYLAQNNSFRLPQDEQTPIIMIGAGTGIAPYRAFLQERESRGRQGENWLLFGNRHFHRDFLYQSDWIKYRDSGLLDRISVAFSRDQTERIYVQDRLLDEGAEIYAWLQEGAQIYVCGGIEMEKAVSQSLTQVWQTHANTSDELAQEAIDSLRAQGRYLKDVY
jgi:sulfite reductase (NADPH) flavoprotein alpha-component